LVLTDYGSGTYAPGRVFGRARLRGVTGLAAISRWSAFNDLRWPSHKPSRILYGGGDHIGTVPAGARGPKQFDFLVVGRLLPHKGLHIAVDSLPAGASLVVAGPRASSDPEYVRELEARVADGSVRFVFDASDTDLVGLYDQARFTLSCAVSSYRHKQYARPELLGLTMLESIHRGTPCAGSRIAGVGEVLTDLGMPTAEPGSVPAWQQLLSTLHNMSPSDYEALALRAEARASDFTWDAAAARTDDLYAEVAGAGAR
jgi:glycosyltransferase involved in cell wall biosynthesis